MNIIFFTCIFVIEQVYQNKLSTKATGSSCSDWNRPLTALRCRPSGVSLLRCSLTASRASQMCLPLRCVPPQVSSHARRGPSPPVPRRPQAAASAAPAPAPSPSPPATPQQRAGSGLGWAGLGCSTPGPTRRKDLCREVLRGFGEPLSVLRCPGEPFPRQVGLRDGSGAGGAEGSEELRGLRN